jgi:hypothetical protein
MSIPDPVMVVCIDGPTRGRLRAITSPEKTRFHAYDMTVITAAKAGETTELTFHPLTYHVHRISFLGFDIRVASMQIDISNIDPYDVISAIFNESGRQATYRVNEPAT